MIKTTGTFKSSDKITDVVYYVYTPEREINPKAILQISHGMCEYIERYEELAEFLTANGVVVCGNDHLGHGKTAADIDNLGYFGDSDGDTYLIRDVHSLYEIMRQKYRRLPYIMLGHSMGSFIVRSYMTNTNYGNEIDGVILSGTSGADVPYKYGKLIASVISILKGKKYRSKTLRKLIFKNYNHRFADESEEFSWITKDKDIRNKYTNDDHCNFIFTTYGYRDMFKLLETVSKDDWAGDIPLSLPVLFMSGTDDPVGNYGDGVKSIYEKLVDVELNDIALKLYDSDRHEILNETDRLTVFNDILGFVNHVYEGIVEVNKL
jgi:Lysophospholipase